jgi:hypothetical protein
MRFGQTTAKAVREIKQATGASSAVVVLIISTPEGSDLAILIAPSSPPRQHYLVHERTNVTRFTPMEAAPDTTAVEDDFIEVSIEVAMLARHGDSSPAAQEVMDCLMRWSQVLGSIALPSTC